jgi:hypothetical protein
MSGWTGTGVKVPNLNPVTWAADLIWESVLNGIQRSFSGMWALWMMRNKRDAMWTVEQQMGVQQAVLWARDTTHDLWQLSHPLKPRDDAQEPTRSWMGKD